MNKNFTRVAALMAAVLMSVSAVSCSDNKKNDEKAKSEGNLAGGDLPDNANVKEEDMPYGAQYKRLTVEDDGLPMSIEFDNRYMTDDEAKQVVNYFWSLSSKEPSYLEAAVHPDLLKYRLESANTTAQEFLNSEYDLIKGYTGSDFTFTFALVDGMMKDDSGFEFYDDLIEKTMPDAKVTDKKVFMVNCTYSRPDDPNGVYSLQMRLGDYVDIAVYTIDGKPYIIS